MRKKNLLFIPFILGIGIILSNCLGNMKNSVTLQDSPAVVSWNMLDGKTTIGIENIGYIAAPSITDVSEGDCILLRKYTIDFDNQPSQEYFTATDIVKENVDQAFLEHLHSFSIGDYTLPILNIEASVSPFYNGKIFIYANCRDKNPDLRLIYNTADQETDNVKNFYLIAKPSSTDSNTKETMTLKAFDLKYLAYSLGTDTTVIDQVTNEEINLKYLKANLRFFSKLSEKGDPEYLTFSSRFTMYFFRN